MPKGGARAGAGPKHKPTALHERDGTKRADRTNFNEPVYTNPPAAIDIPPSHLDAFGQEWWKYHTPRFSQAGVLTEADVSLLVTAAERWSLYRRSSAKLVRNRFLGRNRFGEWVVAPANHVAEKALNAYLAIMREFGVGPASRTKVVAKREAENDEFEEMFA